MLGTLVQTVRFPITPAASLLVSDLYFPLASAPAAFWAAVRADGGDIRVTTQDGVTQCAVEVTGFDYANKTGQLWFSASGGSVFNLCAGSYQDAAAASAICGSQAVWESDAKAIYHCNDASGSVLDSTANANHATLKTGSLTYGAAGKFGKALYGVSTGRIETTGSVLTSSAYSMGGWVKMNSTIATVYACSRGSAAGWEGFGSSDGKRTVFNGTKQILGPNVVADQWNHVMFVRTGVGNAVILYVNGEAEISDDLPITFSTGNAVIMGRPDYPGLYWNGYVDEIRFYDRPLSQAEIQQRIAIQNDPASFWTVGGPG